MLRLLKPDTRRLVPPILVATPEQDPVPRLLTETPEPSALYAAIPFNEGVRSVDLVDDGGGSLGELVRWQSLEAIVAA